MPIYEYECQKCGDVFELIQKKDDPPPKKHDECGSRRVKKLMSAGSFILKGSGWYVTDYARKEKKDEAARRAKASKSEGESKETTSSDKKTSEGKTSEGKTSESKGTETKSSDKKSSNDTKSKASAA